MQKQNTMSLPASDLQFARACVEFDNQRVCRIRFAGVATRFPSSVRAGRRRVWKSSVGGRDDDMVIVMMMVMVAMMMA